MSELAEVRAMLRLHAWWTRKAYEHYVNPPLLRWKAVGVELSEPTAFGIWRVVLAGPSPSMDHFARPTVLEFLHQWVPV